MKKVSPKLACSSLGLATKHFDAKIGGRDPSGLSRLLAFLVCKNDEKSESRTMVLVHLFDE